MGLGQRGLRRERHGARPAERAGELGKDRQIGVKPDPIESTDAQRGERPIVLQTAEFSLDG